MDAELFDIPEEFYFHEEELSQFIYIQVPLFLIKEEVFRGISDSAKILYGLLLNRTGLSMKKKWFDENNRAYINYTIKQVMEDLGIGKTKAKALFAELTDINGTGIGLIRKERIIHKASRIYVMNFTEVYEYLKLLEVEKTSGQIVQKFEENAPEAAEIQVGRKCDPQSAADTAHSRPQVRPTVSRNYGPQSAADATPINKDIIDNNIINIDKDIKSDTDIIPVNPTNHKKTYDMTDGVDAIHEIDSVKKRIKGNVKYEAFAKCPKRWDIHDLDTIIGIMADEYVCGGDFIIGERSIPHELMKSAIEGCDFLTMKKTLDSLDNNTNWIKVPRKYILTVIYNTRLVNGMDTKLNLHHEIMSQLG